MPEWLSGEERESRKSKAAEKCNFLLENFSWFEKLAVRCCLQESVAMFVVAICKFTLPASLDSCDLSLPLEVSIHIVPLI